MIAWFNCSGVARELSDPIAMLRMIPPDPTVTVAKPSLD
jgi:hypothetical protein